MDEPAAYEGRGPASRIPSLVALVGVLGLAGLAGRSLMAPGFFDAHDNLLNIHRLYEMDKCFADQQWACRWAPDMGFGFGLPLFNYYPPLATYVGELGRWLGLTHVDAVKASMLLCLLVGAATMFALARELFGVSAGVLAAVLYTWAPYRAVDLYVRGALAEALGLAILPLVFWTALRVARGGAAAPLWAVACALVWCALLLTHHLVVVMAAPLYAIWWLLLLRDRKQARFPHLSFGLAHLGGIALAAWFLLPSLLERDAIHLGSTLSLYEWNRYANNFLSFQQILFGTKPWGHGAIGSPNAMSLFAGALHWGLSLLALGALFWQPRRKLALARGGLTSASVLLFALGGWIALSMALPISLRAWEWLPGLAYLQFPRRFLGIAAFGFSLAADSLARTLAIPPNMNRLAVAALCLAAIALNWRYFAPAQMHAVRNEALANERQIARSRHGALDYLPRAVDLEAVVAQPPLRDPRPAYALDAEAREPAVLSELARGSNQVQFVARVAEPNSAHSAPAGARATGAQESGATERGALVRINTYRFAGWRVEIDGEEVSMADDPDPLGRIHLRIPPGQHRVRAILSDTPVRRASNAISSAAAALLPIGLFVAWRSSRGGPAR
jgi:hypothetical protein